MTSDYKFLIDEYGYRFLGTCTCDGWYTEKYMLNEYQVRIRIHQRKFKVRRYGGTIRNWKPTTELKKTIDELNTKII